MKASAHDAQLVQHYLRAYRLVAIYAGVAPATGRTLIGFCHNVEAQLHALRAEHGKVTMYSIWWCANDDTARQLLRALPRGAGAALALAELPKAAKVAGVILTPNAEIQQHVRANIDIMRLRSARDLSKLNSAYRETRLARAAAGFKTVSYAQFRHRNEIRMIYADAENNRQRPRKVLDKV